MKTAVINGPGVLELMEKPKPVPAEGEALVRVEYCGICGSDVHAFKSGMFPWGNTFGHEYSGVIEELGPGTGNWAVGQQVTGLPKLKCDQCRLCLSGKDNICEAMNIVGVTREGAMAGYVIVPVNSLFKLSADTLKYGALTEPYSVALQGVNISGISGNDLALIQGAGPIGLCVLIELKRRGVERVLVYEVNETRSEAARRLGASDVINPLSGDASRLLEEHSEGRGAEIVFECAGLPETIAESCYLVASGGKVVVMGICETPVEINFLGLVTREIQMMTAYGCTAEGFGKVTDLIVSGELDFSPLITGTIPLDRVEEGFAALQDPKGSDIKIIVKTSD